MADDAVVLPDSENVIAMLRRTTGSAAVFTINGFLSELRIFDSLNAGATDDDDFEIVRGVESAGVDGYVVIDAKQALGRPMAARKAERVLETRRSLKGCYKIPIEVKSRHLTIHRGVRVESGAFVHAPMLRWAHRSKAGNMGRLQGTSGIAIDDLADHCIVYPANDEMVMLSSDSPLQQGSPEACPARAQPYHVAHGRLRDCVRDIVAEFKKFRAGGPEAVVGGRGAGPPQSPPGEHWSDRVWNAPLVRPFHAMLYDIDWNAIAKPGVAHVVSHIADSEYCARIVDEQTSDTLDMAPLVADYKVQVAGHTYFIEQKMVKFIALDPSYRVPEPSTKVKLVGHRNGIWEGRQFFDLLVLWDKDELAFVVPVSVTRGWRRYFDGVTDFTTDYTIPNRDLEPYAAAVSPAHLVRDITRHLVSLHERGEFPAPENRYGREPWRSGADLAWIKQVLRSVPSTSDKGLLALDDDAADDDDDDDDAESVYSDNEESEGEGGDDGGADSADGDSGAPPGPQLVREGQPSRVDTDFNRNRQQDLLRSTIQLRFVEFGALIKLPRGHAVATDFFAPYRASKAELARYYRSGRRPLVFDNPEFVARCQGYAMYIRSLAKGNHSQKKEGGVPMDRMSSIILPRDRHPTIWLIDSHPPKMLQAKAELGGALPAYLVPSQRTNYVVGLQSRPGAGHGGGLAGRSESRSFTHTDSVIDAIPFGWHLKDLNQDRASHPGSGEPWRVGDVAEAMRDVARPLDARNVRAVLLEPYKRACILPEQHLTTLYDMLDLQLRKKLAIYKAHHRRVIIKTNKSHS